MSKAPLYPKGTLVRFRENTNRAGEVWVVESDHWCGNLYLQETNALTGRRVAGIVADGRDVEVVADGITL